MLILFPDVVRSILFAIQNENIRGPVNVTAPSPITMEAFGKTIGAVLHRPHWLPVPSVALKLALGKKKQPCAWRPACTPGSPHAGRIWIHVRDAPASFGRFAYKSIGAKKYRQRTPRQKGPSAHAHKNKGLPTAVFRCWETWFHPDDRSLVFVFHFNRY